MVGGDISLKVAAAGPEPLMVHLWLSDGSDNSSDTVSYPFAIITYHLPKERRLVFKVLNGLRQAVAPWVGGDRPPRRM